MYRRVVGFPGDFSFGITPILVSKVRSLRGSQGGSVIALWLGHESIETTQIYLHADLAIKERALARTAPTGTTPGRYRAPDTLLAFLEAL